MQQDIGGFDLYYKERIGNPVTGTTFTEEYRVLTAVSCAFAEDFKARFHWIRSVWRIVPHTEKSEPV